MALPVTHYRFSVTDYYKMAEAGVLTEDSRVELIDGEILEMNPIGSPHSGGVGRISAMLWREFGESAVIWVQNPIRLNDYSEPEPDLALLRPRDDFFTSSHPTSSDVLLVIEVADTSFDYDRQIKAPLYARNEIPEYWLADLSQRRVLIYTDPTEGEYASIRVAQVGETVSPRAFPDVEISVSEIVG